MDKEIYRVNEEIRAEQVRLIDEEGNQLGVMTGPQALNLAIEKGLDLVEISPSADPPVCKLIDYSKLKYQMEKKAKLSRKSQKNIQVKEIKIRPKIGQHDLEVKLRHVQEFLEKKDKVKITIVFRGRETAHADLGQEILKNIQERFADSAAVEQIPRLEGFSMSMLLAPLKK